MQNLELTDTLVSTHGYSSEYTWLAQSLPVVVDKGYGHHIGKALHSATY